MNISDINVVPAPYRIFQREASVKRIACLLAFSLLIGCGGGGGGGSSTTPVTTHDVTLSWATNRESGVNSPGGGYQVVISGQPTVNVPYTSGPTTPISVTVPLQAGTYTVTVRAYASLDTQGGSNGSLSAPSAPITVNVP